MSVRCDRATVYAYCTVQRLSQLFQVLLGMCTSHCRKGRVLSPLSLNAVAPADQTMTWVENWLSWAWPCRIVQAEANG